MLLLQLQPCGAASLTDKVAMALVLDCGVTYTCDMHCNQATCTEAPLSAVQAQQTVLPSATVAAQQPLAHAAQLWDCSALDVLQVTDKPQRPLTQVQTLKLLAARLASLIKDNCNWRSKAACPHTCKHASSRVLIPSTSTDRHWLATPVNALSSSVRSAADSAACRPVFSSLAIWRPKPSVVSLQTAQYYSVLEIVTVSAAMSKRREIDDPNKSVVYLDTLIQKLLIKNLHRRHR